jgi:hypothetical protein
VPTPIGINIGNETIPPCHPPDDDTPPPDWPVIAIKFTDATYRLRELYTLSNILHARKRLTFRSFEDIIKLSF